MKNLLSILLLCLSLLSHAQKFEPGGNTITVVVSNAPGGPGDSAGRIFAEYLTKRGFNAVVQNRPGAGQTLGATYLATQPGNNYMLMVGAKSAYIYPPLSGVPNLAWNENTFPPVGYVGSAQLVLVTNPTQIRSTAIGDLVAEHAQNSQRINFGTFAGIPELYLNQAMTTGATKPNVVIYTSSAKLLTDVIGGSVQVGLLDLNSAKPLIESGKLQAINWQSPSILTSWWGIYAAPGASREAVEFYSNMLVAMHADPESQGRLRRAFNAHRAMTLTEFEQFHRSEVQDIRNFLGGAKR